MDFNLDKNSFDEQLFYFNKRLQLGADPGAMWVDKADDPINGGYFYAITTGGELNDGTKVTGAFTCYKSKDLTNWEVCGAERGFALRLNPTDWPQQDFWAPEFFHEKIEVDGKIKNRYYMYFCAVSKEGNSQTEYTSIPLSESRFSRFYLGIAVSDCPYGPFTLVDTNTYYSFYGKDQKVNANNHVVNGTTPPFNFYKYNQELQDYYKENGYIGDFFPCIDISPFLDPATGDFYCYFSMHPSVYSKSLAIWVVKMKDFITPDYSTMHLIAMPGYSVDTVDFKPYVNDETINFGQSEKYSKHVTRFYYDGTEFGAGINEGANTIAYFDKKTNRWLYYLTYSPFGFPSRAYSVLQAVSTSPNGPFKKLNPHDGQVVIGILNWDRNEVCQGQDNIDYSCQKDLSASIDYMSGNGHHTFVNCGGDIFAVYHTLTNPVYNYDEQGKFLGRRIACDRVTFNYSEILKYNFLIGEDLSNNNSLPVIYGNGPTYSVQPLPEKLCGYKNLIKDCVIDACGKKVEFLKSENFVVHTCYKQSEFVAQNNIIKVTLNGEKTLRAIMLYNSCDINYALKQIKNITIFNKDKVVLSQNNIPQNPNNYSLKNNVMNYGGSIVVSFKELKATHFVIELSSNDKLINNNEIIKTGSLVVLGK